MGLSNGTCVCFDFGSGDDGAADLDGINQYSWAGVVYVFTVSPATVTPFATYTSPNGNTFSVIDNLSGGTILHANGSQPPDASGVLTLVGGVGDATIAYSSFAISPNSYTLLRQVFLTDLTIRSGVTLYSAGYSITGNGTLKTEAGAVIDDSGGDGVSGLGNSGLIGFGGLSPVRDPQGFLTNSDLDAGTDGQSGLPVSSTTGANGNQPQATIMGLYQPVYGKSNSCGIAGNGGDGSGGNSGGVAYTPGTISSIITYWKFVTKNFIVSYFANGAGGGMHALDGGVGGGSGGGGGGDGTNNGGFGGGGGAGGGHLAIFFNILNNLGTIQANGGNGGAGGSPLAGDAGGGGGGAGGAGGFVYMINGSTISSGTIQALGGSGGAGGTHSGAGTDGSPGTAGQNGPVLRFDMALNAWQ